jgi:hypothetical protein
MCDISPHRFTPDIILYKISAIKSNHIAIINIWLILMYMYGLIFIGDDSKY